MKQGITELSGKWLDARTWERLISGHDPVKMSVKDYCAKQGVSSASYYRWQKRLHEGRGEELFSPIEIGSGRIEGSIELELPGGVLLRFGVLPPVEYLRQLSSAFSGH